MITEILLTTDIIIFFGTLIIAVIAIIFYLTAIDKRVTVLETKTIDKDEFYKAIEKLRESIETKIEEEIDKIK